MFELFLKNCLGHFYSFSIVSLVMTFVYFLLHSCFFLTDLLDGFKKTFFLKEISPLSVIQINTFLVPHLSLEFVSHFLQKISILQDNLTQMF